MLKSLKPFTSLYTYISYKGYNIKRMRVIRDQQREKGVI